MRSLVVKVTVGEDAPERCMQGLTVAATAAATGASVSLWLTGEAVWLATPGRDLEIPQSAPASALLAGLDVTVCTQCVARRSLTQEDFREGVKIAGAAAFVELALREDAQALVY